MLPQVKSETGSDRSAIDWPRGTWGFSVVNGANHTEVQSRHTIRCNAFGLNSVLSWPVCSYIIVCHLRVERLSCLNVG